MTSIADLSGEPQFTIREVCKRTGIRAVTLRAWERRHELLSPHRSENRYRMYSEQDVAILRWVKERVDNGVPISSAAYEIRSMLQNGIWPEALEQASRPAPIPSGIPARVYAQKLYEAMVRHDENAASEIMREVYPAFTTLSLCMDVLVPCLIEIGEAWYNGKIRVTTEHFASAYLRGRLLALMQSMPSRRNGRYIMAGCAPDEQHEIGSLMLAVLLREAGYRVEFLGPDLPLEDLVDYAAFERPELIILSATMEDSARQLARMQDRLNTLKQKPLFGFGGRAFNSHPELQKTTGGIFLGETLADALETINNRLKP